MLSIDFIVRVCLHASGPEGWYTNKATQTMKTRDKLYLFFALFTRFLLITLTAFAVLLPEKVNSVALLNHLTTISLPLVFKDYSHPQPGWWQPPPNTTWQWQLSDQPVDTSYDVDMYDIDLFDNKAKVVEGLHSQGRKAVCYISAGSWEDWRPDAQLFPPEVIGKKYSGWPDEKWLDIRRIDLLAPIMRSRFDMCKAKGFDGIEPDNIDGYTNDTGFPLTYNDQLDYNKWLAQEAHTRGLSIGLKNDGEQAGDLLPFFDWAMVEDCYTGDFCDEFVPFIQAGKAVFAAEYTDEISVNKFLNQVCPSAASIGFSFILKDRDLDSWVKFCP